MKKLTYVLASLLVVTSASSCGKKNNEGVGVYTYHDYTTVSPSNWNELTYEDNNDTQIMKQISSSFFSFDYKFDDSGKIVSGDFTVNYDAATKLEDVTKTYAGVEKWGIPTSATSAAFVIASAASIAAVSPLVSTIPKASCAMIYSS